MPNRRVFPLAIIIRFDVLKEPGLSHTSSHVPFAVKSSTFILGVRSCNYAFFSASLNYTPAGQSAVPWQKSTLNTFV